MPDLRLRGLTKAFGASPPVVDRVDLAVEDREFVSLLGPSGSGKTTILRMIAGHIAPTAGEVRVSGRRIDGLPPEKRDVGMVFQSYALFPHLTVFENVAFGLRRRRVDRAELFTRVGEALTLVRLTSLESRYPRELSGGQQQRVALARALVVRPALLLLDEPLSNLDARLRAEMRTEIRRLQRELGLATLLVTHDQEEALTMADRIAVMCQGQIRQVAAPTDLYRTPADRFVAEFVGRMNLFPGVKVTTGARATYRLSGGAHVQAPNGPAHGLVGVRPEEIRLSAPPREHPVNQLEGYVGEMLFLGELREVRVDLADRSTLVVRAPVRDLPDTRLGDKVVAWWPADATSVFPVE